MCCFASILLNRSYPHAYYPVPTYGTNGEDIEMPFDWRDVPSRQGSFWGRSGGLGSEHIPIRSPGAPTQ
jgi:hypothetical protein